MTHNPNYLQTFPNLFFPKELAYRVIRLFTDERDIVLDPFLGSGATAVAAIKTNRNFIGIEMMKKYAEIATKNVKIAQYSQKLFSANTQKPMTPDERFNKNESVCLQAALL